MAEPYIGEIRMFAGNFAPQGWYYCNGQVLSIAGNDTLFTLLGTTYGGDGQNTFALPNLQGRLPVHLGPGFVQGEQGGTETVQLTVPQMPSHSHILACNSGDGNSTNPAGNFWAGQPALLPYADGTVGANYNTTMKSTAFGPAGSSQAHDNMMPYVAVGFIIAAEGIFPARD
jgi:microcystin-dependent protein